MWSSTTGWLHFRFRDIQSSDFRVGPMELMVKDAMSSHVGRASGPRHLPGKVWPCIPNSSTKGKTDAAGAGVTGRPITGNDSAFRVISKDGELESYYWVVICKNRKFHEQQNIYSGHKIALCEKDEFTPPPQMEPFTVRCDEFGENQAYDAFDLVRFQMPTCSEFQTAFTFCRSVRQLQRQRIFVFVSLPSSSTISCNRASLSRCSRASSAE
jgi:hypothetical protein